MQVQRLTLPIATLSPPVSSHYYSYSTPNTKIIFPKPIFASGFCISLKTISKLSTGLGKPGGGIGIMAGIRCGVAAQEGYGDDNDHDDGFYIRRCVEIARKATGYTSPNPMVGCVIVKEGKIIGEGFHPKAGQPHAEVFALRDAGDLTENATAYVSLEPCNHFGRTPPCTEALIKAKVKRVVVGMVDPNPIVASKGVNRLRSAGIEVTVGVEEELCKSLLESYIHQMLTGKPFVTLRIEMCEKLFNGLFLTTRYSLSVNGQIVDQLGEGSAESGGYYSKLLQEYDAIIVSSASISDKFSFPPSQEPGANQPLWIITANHSSSIRISHLPVEAAAKAIIFSNQEIIDPEIIQRGIETVVQNHISLNAILEYSKRQGFCSVLLDLRGSVDDIKELLEEGVEQNLLQKIVIEVLPHWVESDGKISSVALKGLDRKLDIKNLKPKISGKSVLLEGYF
ncbi:Riboflavin biosynthesis protein RibD [Parasponia andersonii]|uniref:Riboflavin biosynthesis protein PYRD, chloroplastic n=1 Tax=Parasponia andersonii TaxID=3476 RepID=A0A2P5C6V2_PARAD|nr:Riboflavin biosynthesis protein RibD [Parasponia andersonii]